MNPSIRMKNLLFMLTVALLSTAPLSAGTGPTEKRKVFLRLIEQERIVQDASCPPSEVDEILEFDKIALDEKRTKLLEILAREAKKQRATTIVTMQSILILTTESHDLEPINARYLACIKK